MRPTPFQMRVYDALREVPRGYVTTYGLLARRIGCGSARAVGGALRRNPFAPEVPCHRVIASGGTAGGFQGRRGGPAIQRKLELLRDEGVCLDEAGRLADPARLYRF
ncbi:MAG: MGMT family protein [Lentisphaerae bacterium]|jgi:methylated-DNA-[protein]-cysteine S-methyltransferase|nr:MGMT family protein [Lentisphaerota bacterium]